MYFRHAVSRRGFVGGVAGALGYLGIKPDGLWAQGDDPMLSALLAQQQDPIAEYDRFAKLANNENPAGPPESVMKAMTRAFKYSNRYGYPDGGIVEAIAKHHGVKRQNVMLGAGSAEILEVVGSSLLEDGKKVVGVDPTYNTVYSHASGIKADAIRLPLLEDYTQDIPAMINATRKNYRDVGFVYLCNPNNPTGRIVKASEVKQLLDGIPEDMPVLIDEAYHHYVQDPEYATSVPYVLEGRQVIIARTFSKIYGMAGMRLGYAIAPEPLINQMERYGTGTINALVKWGGVAALADTQTVEKVARSTIELRNKTMTDLRNLGYSVIPSETNFFMVHLRRPMQPVIGEFRRKGVLVGRPFPPMLEHLRVSVGTADEMARFMKAFGEVIATKTAANG